MSNPLLGLRGREKYLEREVTAAYDTLAGTPLEEGYSPRVAAGRLAVLGQAVQHLRSTNGQAPLMGAGLEVEWDHLNGALALMQEVGEFDLVISLGTKLLAKWESRPFRRDVLLSMALAQCGLASEVLGLQQTTAGCARLEEALSTLRDGGSPALAPTLQADIRQSLQELRPHCVLDQLKLPLATEHTDTRKAAISALRGLLANPEAAAPVGGDTPITAEYAQKALAALTVGEIVQLMGFYVGLLEMVAGAHMLSGFLQRRPAAVRTAARLLACADRQLIARSDLQDGTVLVQAAVVRVLLGQPQAALDLIVPSAEGPRVRPDTGSAASTLSEGGSRARIGTVAAHTAGSISHAGRLQAVSLQEAAALVEAHAEQAAAGEDPDTLPGLVLLTERWLTKVAVPAFRDSAEQRASVSLVEYFQDERVTTSLQLDGEDGSGVWGNMQGMYREAVGSMQQLLRRPEDSMPASAQAVAGQAPVPSQPSQAQQPLPRSSRLDEPQPQLWQKLVQKAMPTLLLLGGVVLAAAFALSRQRQRAGRLAQPPQAATARTVTAHSLRQQQAALPSLAEAEQVVRSWQEAKAEGLGPRHSLQAAQQVLTEPFLSEFTAEVASAEETGWFWKYELGLLEVQSVERSADGQATIRAQLGEKADLYGANGKHADSYNNPYVVEYQAERQHDGSWRLSSALVVGQ
eukprot:jgi/Astpho2/7485/Aster-x1440